MPVLLDAITPSAGSIYTLLDDSLLKGGFRVVNTRSDLDKLNATVLKLGMWIAVNDEQGKIYECMELEITEDMFGDKLISKCRFEPVSANAGPELKLETRKSLVVTFAEITPSQTITLPANFGCRSLVLTSLTVPVGRKLDLAIYSNKDKTDAQPYRFNSERKSYDDGSTYLKNRTRFQYKKFYLLVNTEVDTVDQHIFMLEATSRETSTYYTSKRFDYTSIPVTLTYIPLET